MPGDWSALGSLAGVVLAALSAAGALIAYGVYQQKVKDVEKRLDEHDQHIEKLERAIDTQKEAAGKVELLAAEIRSFKGESSLRQDGVLQEVRHLNELWTERFAHITRSRTPRGVGQG